MGEPVADIRAYGDHPCVNGDECQHSDANLMIVVKQSRIESAITRLRQMGIHEDQINIGCFRNGDPQNFTVLTVDTLGEVLAESRIQHIDTLAHIYVHNYVAEGGHDVALKTLASAVAGSYFLRSS